MRGGGEREEENRERRERHRKGEENKHAMEEGVSYIGGMGNEMEKSSFTRFRRIEFWEEEGCLGHCTVGEVTSLPPGT